MPSGRQTFDYDCGAKALQLVLAYYGLDFREDVLIEELGTTEYGTLAKNMAEFSRGQGFEVIVEKGMILENLKKYIDERRPVIVLMQAWVDRYMTIRDWEAVNEHGHYVVVIGYKDGIMIFEDPSSFPRTWMTEEEFLSRWHYTDIRTKENMDRFAVVLTGKEPAVTSRLEHMD